MLYDELRCKVNNMKAKLDPLIEQAIKVAAKKNNVSYSIAREVVMNNFNWLRSSISKAEYANYLMPRFGTFKYFVRKSKEGIDIHEEEITEYYNRNRVRDHNMVLDTSKLSEEEIGEKNKVIDNIVKHKPCDNTSLLEQKKFNKAYWCFKDEYDWNRNYMLITYSVSELTELKNIIEDGQKKESN